MEGFYLTLNHTIAIFPQLGNSGEDVDVFGDGRLLHQPVDGYERPGSANSGTVNQLD